MCALDIQRGTLGGSKIGRRPIVIPTGVDVLIKDGDIEIKGPKGILSGVFNHSVKVSVQGSELLIVCEDAFDRISKSYQGLYAKLFSNMITGVTSGFSKVLMLVGTGYRSKLDGKKLELSLGYSHPVVMEVPEGLNCLVEENGTKITIQGIDKERVGQFAADIRKKRSPEPYKGKGVRYQNEHVRRKAGKSGKSK